MAPLRNNKQELFANALAKGKTQSAAYIEAGYAANAANAANLAKEPAIVARRQELIEERDRLHGEGNDPLLEHIQAVDDVLETGEISNKWIILQLVENTYKAQVAQNFNASNKSLELLARINGLLTEKPKNKDEEKEKTREIEEKNKNKVPNEVLLEAIRHLQSLPVSSIDSIKKERPKLTVQKVVPLSLSEVPTIAPEASSGDTSRAP